MVTIERSKKDIGVLIFKIPSYARFCHILPDYARIARF